MNARQKRIEVIKINIKDEYYNQKDYNLMEYGIKKLEMYMKSKRRGFITASEYNLYRDAIEKFIGVK